MKNYKKILLALSALLILLAGCKKEEPQPEPVPDKWPATINVDGVGKFILVEVDSINGFTMGLDDGSNSAPAHKVILSKPYYLGEMEVTQKVWKDIMGANPSDDSAIGDNYPVNKITNSNILDFIKKLNAKTGREFALPSEAQWEFAAMGGLKSNNFLYSGSNTINDVAWWTGNSEDVLQEVGKKQPNELGLYDMSGNIGEYVADKMTSYSSKEQKDPVSTKGTGNVFRGGTFDGSSDNTAVKSRLSASAAFYNIGFRLMLTAPNENELVK